jgi:hypothetical protein
MVRRRGFKIFQLENIEPSSHLHLKGGDPVYFGREALPYWFLC